MLHCQPTRRPSGEQLSFRLARPNPEPFPPSPTMKSHSLLTFHNLTSPAPLGPVPPYPLEPCWGGKPGPEKPLPSCPKYPSSPPPPLDFPMVVPRRPFVSWHGWSKTPDSFIGSG
ncbi:hypothetical protein NHX12_004337 [Muraenolepis orangiensis]|uniref:Uncharacterized protein n=1 Tax=Muraenolepis orangiensis TaxID=630683 RepID=A0A9Q0IC38_9TELE|nr:hypothetical protein NHX12_004337 [Muraenolepis orangiensis]